MGLAAPGQGGSYVQQHYERLLPHIEASSRPSPVARAQDLSTCLLNINTHGGLMAQGAPWEAPAMYSLVEAVEQLRGRATGRQVSWLADGGCALCLADDQVGRQVPGAQTALVYGNGGIFSASAVAILRRRAEQGPSSPRSRL